MVFTNNVQQKNSSKAYKKAVYTSHYFGNIKKVSTQHKIV